MTLLNHNQDYQQSNHQGRVMHENKDLFPLSKENALEPIEQRLTREKSLERFTDNAVAANTNGDRNAAEKGNPCSTLTFIAQNLALLFQGSDASVKGRLVRDALYLSVAMTCESDDLLTRDQQEWNEIITYNMEFPDELVFPDDPDKSRTKWATYAVYLLSDLLSISDGGKRGQQGILSSKDLTPRESLTLFCCVFEVPTFRPNHLRTSSLNRLQETISRSKLFVEDQEISEAKERISALESHFSIRLPDWTETVEPKLLDIFTAYQWSSIDIFVSQTHAEFPSLKHPQHSLRLLLVWSAQCTGRTREKLYVWANSDHGTKEYHKMGKALLHPNGLAETALISGAVKFLLRLRESHPYGVAHSSHFIDIVKDMRGGDAPTTTLEHMSKASDRVLSEQVNGTEYQKIREILARFDPDIPPR